MKNNKLKISDLARLVSTLEMMGALYYTARVHAQDKETKQKIVTIVVMGQVFRESDGKFLFTLPESLRCPATSAELANAEQKN